MNNSIDPAGEYWDKKQNRKEIHMVKERKDTGTNDSKLRIASDNQYEMTEAETPLYLACEEMVKAKARVNGAKENLEKAEEVCVAEMKKTKKKQVSHKGDLLLLVNGKTIEDHIRFSKP